MSDAFRLRPYKESDEDDAVALWHDTWQRTYPDIDFTARLAWWRTRWRNELVPNAVIVVAEIERELAGFVTIDADGYLDQIVVASAHWGTLLAAALLDAAKARSPAGVTLKVNADNARAVRFYQRNGFVHDGDEINQASGRAVWRMTWKPKVTIRDATPDDAAQACDIMIRSIRELCVADHQNDSAIVSDWLANKQPEIVRTWIERTDNSLMVACLGDIAVAVGSVTDVGEIQLNYVSPDVRFLGVSSAMLNALEKRALERGISTVRLVSTATAHRFYKSRGYNDDGTPEGRFGTTSSYPMSKTISA